MTATGTVLPGGASGHAHAGVVRAGRVVGEVQVDDQVSVVAAEVGALDGVDDVPAARVRQAVIPGVADWHEDAAAVGRQPPDVQVADAGQVHHSGPLEGHGAVGAGLHLDPDRRHVGVYPRGESQRRVVRRDRRRHEFLPLAGRDRRLRVAGEEFVPGGLPGLMRRGRIGNRAHGGVDGRDPAAPVQQ